MPKNPSPKSDATRARIAEAALALFAEQGFRATTMRQIAEAASCSPGLTYRYFARKEEIVFELYEQLADELLSRSDALTEASVGARFHELMTIKLALLGEHRRALLGLVAPALDPEADIAVLSSSTSGIRSRVRESVAVVVGGASPSVAAELRPPLVDGLYVLHLLVVLFWTHDRSPEQVATERVLGFAQLALDALLGLDASALSAGLSQLTHALAALFPNADQEVTSS